MVDARDGGEQGDPVDLMLKDGEPREPVEEMRLMADLKDRLFGGSKQVVTLSRYIVLERLAVGGAGVVYTAYDPELDRKVAIKLLNARPRNEAADSETRSRLLREAQAMARLSHPNVIGVYDVGTYDEHEKGFLGSKDDDDVPSKGVFVVMELVDGRNLADWLRVRERPWMEVLDVFLAAGRGLAAAHAGGLVHRDFKPANVLVGDDGRVRVLDFGLARAVGDHVELPTISSAVPAGDSQDHPAVTLDDPDRPTREIPRDNEQSEAKPSALQAGLLDGSLTRTGTIMGTPAYMAPEQHRGTAHGEAVDQFSYCAALYEGLYGQLPFAGRTLDALEQAKTSGKLEPPPRGKNIPVWLYRAVIRGLAVEPSARFGSMTELLLVLERGVRRRRRRIPLAVGALVVTLGSGALALSWGGGADACAGQAKRLEGVWDVDVRTNVEAAFVGTQKPFALAAWQSVARDLDGYAQRWARMRTEVCAASLAPDEDQAEVLGRQSLCLDRRLTRLGELTNLFRDADGDVVERAIDAVGALPPLEHCAGASSRMGGATPVDSEARAKVLEIDAELAHAEALRHGGRFAEAIESARAAVTAAEAVGHLPTLTRALSVLARLHHDGGDPSAAEQALHHALHSAERSGDDELALHALVDLVGVTRDRARYDEGEHLAMLAAAKLDFRGLRDELDAQLALDLGALRKAQGRYEEALRALADAQTLMTRLFGANHPKVADVINQIGHVHDDRAQYQDALAHYEEALALRTAAFGPDHPKVAACLNNLGNIRTKQGRHDDALADYRRALAINERALGPDHLRTATPVENVGIVLWKLDDDDNALEYLRRALRIRRATLAADHPTIAGSYINIGVVLEELERYDEALEHYRHALEIHERRVGPRHPYFALALSNVAGALAKQGKNKEALEHHQRALDVRERALGPQHPDVAVSLYDLANVSLALNEAEQALSYVERALSIARKGVVEPKALAKMEALHDRLTSADR